MNTSIYRFASLLAIAGAALSASAQVNPGFETGDFTGYTTTPASSGSIFGVGPAGTGGGAVPHSGTYFARFGATGGLPDTISQSITTVPGASYLVSYYLYNDSSVQTTNTQSFTSSFGTGSRTSGVVPAAYALFSFIGTATSASTTLSFGGYSTDAYYLLDDISVTRVQGVPEPASFAALGLGTVAVLRRRKRA